MPLDQAVDSTATGNLEDVIKSVLNNTDYLSEDRIHQIIYLADLAKLESGGGRITSVNYEAKVGGVYSPEISEALGNMDEIVSEILMVAGERVVKYNGDEYSVSIDDGDGDLIRQVCVDNCELKTKDLVRKVKDTTPFRNSKYGQRIDFENNANSSNHQITSSP